MVIKTPRLCLTPLTKHDAEKVFQLRSDPRVARFLGNGCQINREQSDHIFQKLLAHQILHGFSLFTVYELRSKQFIGLAGLIHLALDDTDPDIELVYWLLPEYWGQGFATEAAISCVRWGLIHLHLSKIVAVAKPDHHASIRVLEKAGFQRAGTCTYKNQLVTRLEIKAELNK